MTNFDDEVVERVRLNLKNHQLMSSAKSFMQNSTKPKYSYNFSWLGRPIIQYPQDIVAMQELIWKIKPDLIIETGIAHGGSLIFSASMLALLDMCFKRENESPQRMVLGIDVDIRDHNKKRIEEHPLSGKIKMIQGSSIDENVFKRVKELASNYRNILICLDSNHTELHVLEELRLYAPLTSIGSYCVVFDTIIEDLQDGMYPDRPWSVGNNPKTAVNKFIKENNNFSIDHDVDGKLLISVAPGGYLKRYK
jgi:cephalosporin hydroxylase